MREAAWLVTGPATDPVRHVFVRLEQRVDGSGSWTVEVHLCRERRGHPAAAMHVYPDEESARAAVRAMYALGRHLDALPTWNPDRCEPGRWRVQKYEDDARDQPPTPAVGGSVSRRRIRSGRS